MSDWKSWIGRTDVQSDTITETLVERFVAVVGRPERHQGSDVVPLGLHWCLAVPAIDNGRLGADGHPALGIVVPPVPFSRRLWAGGELAFHEPLRVHDRVTRRSTIQDVRFAEGRSGPLYVIVVRHDYETDRGLSISERQDLVYRSPSANNAALAGDRADADLPGDIVQQIEATPTLLFRYSALTFNGHRIHYDREYARDIEGYPGLVVHAPLQATLLMQLVHAHARAPLVHFAYRCVAPLIDGPAFRIRTRQIGAGTSDLWAIAADGRVATTARATPADAL